jgi:threonine dehydrogenase-like Zn-dependent dehydrogenase
MKKFIGDRTFSIPAPGIRTVRDLAEQRCANDEAPHAYEIFQEKEDECIKVVLKP